MRSPSEDASYSCALPCRTMLLRLQLHSLRRESRPSRSPFLTIVVSLSCFSLTVFFSSHFLFPCLILFLFFARLGTGTGPRSTRAACATSSFATAKTAEWRLTPSGRAPSEGRACVERALTADVPRRSIGEVKEESAHGHLVRVVVVAESGHKPGGRSKMFVFVR